MRFWITDVIFATLALKYLCFFSFRSTSADLISRLVIFLNLQTSFEFFALKPTVRLNPRVAEEWARGTFRRGSADETRRRVHDDQVPRAHVRHDADRPTAAAVGKTNRADRGRAEDRVAAAALSPQSVDGLSRAHIAGPWTRWSWRPSGRRTGGVPSRRPSSASTRSRTTGNGGCAAPTGPPGVCWWCRCWPRPRSW